MSNFESSIALLVAEVKDYQGVETFCLHSGSFQATKKSQKSGGADSKKAALVEDETRRTMFMALLKEYLNMEQDQGGMKLTLGLLGSHSTFLQISEVNALGRLCSCFSEQSSHSVFSTHPTLGDSSTTTLLVCGDASGIPATVSSKELPSKERTAGGQESLLERKLADKR